MSRASKIVAVSEYTTGQGETKKAYKEIGTLVVAGEGKRHTHLVYLNMFPGTVYLVYPEDKEREKKSGGSSKNQPPPPSASDEPVYDDDIPF